MENPWTSDRRPDYEAKVRRWNETVLALDDDAFSDDQVAFIVQAMMDETNRERDVFLPMIERACYHLRRLHERREELPEWARTEVERWKEMHTILCSTSAKGTDE
jgi:hypothetical protein